MLNIELTRIRFCARIRLLTIMCPSGGGLGVSAFVPIPYWAKGRVFTPLYGRSIHPAILIIRFGRCLSTNSTTPIVWLGIPVSSTSSRLVMGPNSASALSTIAGLPDDPLGLDIALRFVLEPSPGEKAGCASSDSKFDTSFFSSFPWCDIP